MEIKTTTQIERRLRELILDAKDLERIDKREKFCEKKWIAVDDLVSQLEDWNNTDGLSLYDVINKIEAMK